MQAQAELGPGPWTVDAIGKAHQNPNAWAQQLISNLRFARKAGATTSNINEIRALTVHAQKTADKLTKDLGLDNN